MTKQPVFPDLCDAMKRKRTRRELFLSEMDAAESVAQTDRAALSEGGIEGRASGDVDQIFQDREMTAYENQI